MFHHTLYPRRKLNSYERNKRTKHFPRIVYTYAGRIGECERVYCTYMRLAARVYYIMR